MTDNMKKFLEAASKDEALKAEMKAFSGSKTESQEAVQAAMMELAAKHGLTLTADDFKPSEITELTEDKLEAVAGGLAHCGCGVAGGGGGDGRSCGCGFFSFGSVHGAP